MCNRLPHKKMIGNGMDLADLEYAIKMCLDTTTAEKRYEARQNRVECEIVGDKGIYVFTRIDIKGNKLVLTLRPEF